jgi:hypothetical protein
VVHRALQQRQRPAQLQHVRQGRGHFRPCRGQLGQAQVITAGRNRRGVQRKRGCVAQGGCGGGGGAKPLCCGNEGRRHCGRITHQARHVAPLSSARCNNRAVVRQQRSAGPCRRGRSGSALRHHGGQRCPQRCGILIRQRSSDAGVHRSAAWGGGGLVRNAAARRPTAVNDKFPHGICLFKCGGRALGLSPLKMRKRCPNACSACDLRARSAT